MERSFQQRMYEHEVPPPAGVFDEIRTRMDEEIHGNNNYGILQHFSRNLVAACLLLFIIAIVFLDLHPTDSSVTNNILKGYAVTEDSTAAPATPVKHQYLTLIGPQGKVKISRKVAAIFTAPDTPSKTQWSKKLQHWKNIMMTASTTDFMDVIPITQTDGVEN